MSEPVLDVLRRELRRLSPGVRIEMDEIKGVLTQEVIKRDVIDGEKADEARKQVAKAANRVLKTKASKPSEASDASGPVASAGGEPPPSGVASES